jgi:hypothetical protein
MPLVHTEYTRNKCLNTDPTRPKQNPHETQNPNETANALFFGFYNYKNKKNYHLLHYCEGVRELWGSIFCLFGVEWVMPRRMVESLAS